ncbi:MAG: hypothetical protein KGV56_04785, partial [Gammaproteobacteria bacterium]|nr:hypothetical protein [Gammaproteobacteria bacterium]
MSKTTKTTTNPKKPLKKYICKHCTQSKTGKEMKCLDEKYLCCLDCHAKRKKTKQPPRTYLCLGCGKEKSYAEMQYQKTEKETG